MTTGTCTFDISARLISRNAINASTGIILQVYAELILQQIKREPLDNSLPVKSMLIKIQKESSEETTTEEEQNQTSSDEEFFDQAVKHLKQVRQIAHTDNIQSMMTVLIEDADVRIEPDSGAEVNIMDEHQH